MDTRVNEKLKLEMKKNEPTSHTHAQAKNKQETAEEIYSTYAFKSFRIVKEIRKCTILWKTLGTKECSSKNELQKKKEYNW